MTASRIHRPEDNARILADNERRATETVRRVRSIPCQCSAVDALAYAAMENPDLVTEALTDAGVDE